MTVKAVENDEFKQKTWDMKRKQKEYYYQHTEEQNILHTGETVLMFRDGKLKSLLLKSWVNQEVVMSKEKMGIYTTEI